MRIKRSELKRIIKEEIQEVLSEGFFGDIGRAAKHAMGGEAQDDDKAAHAMSTLVDVLSPGTYKESELSGMFSNVYQQLQAVEQDNLSNEMSNLYGHAQNLVRAAAAAKGTPLNDGDDDMYEEWTPEMLTQLACKVHAGVGEGPCPVTDVDIQAQQPFAPGKTPKTYSPEELAAMREILRRQGYRRN